MGRYRIKMKLIENEKARKKVFEKRRNNLLKKAKELSILCDVKILLIIYEQDKQKPEIWPDNGEEAEQIINRFKQQPVRGDSRKACDSFPSKKTRSAEKFAISDHNNLINHYPENELQKLCCELDAKIAAVMNAIKSKQALTEGPSKMLGDSQGMGFLNKAKQKEVIIYQEPLHTQEDRSFQMLSDDPNFMESRIMMMMQNGIGYPEFDGSSSSSHIPSVPLPIHYVDPSWIQPDYYDTAIYHIPPEIYYPMIPGFPSQLDP